MSQENVIPDNGAIADAVLVAQGRAGDREAFAELFRRHHPVARRVARRLDTACDADDVAAEVFERVLDQISRGGGPAQDFRSYLLTSVRHEVIRRSRRAHREVLTHEDFLLERIDPDCEVDRLAESHVVLSAFNALPDRWRRVLWLVDVEGMRPREVALSLQLSPNGVSALAYRARRALRCAYADQHADQHTDHADQSVRPLKAIGSTASRSVRSVESTLGPVRSANRGPFIGGAGTGSEVLSRGA